jgi:hypothetical protein
VGRDASVPIQRESNGEADSVTRGGGFETGPRDVREHSSRHGDRQVLTSAVCDR